MNEKEVTFNVKYEIVLYTPVFNARCLRGEGVDLLGDDVDLLGDGGDPKSIAGGSSKTTVAQMGDQRLEIRKCDQLTNLPTNQPTNQLTWVGARDTCVSKNYRGGF